MSEKILKILRNLNLRRLLKKIKLSNTKGISASVVFSRESKMSVTFYK